MMAQTKKLGWGIIGPGGIAQDFFAGIRDSRTGTLVAIGTRNPSKPGLAQAFAGARIVDGYAALIADPEVEAIYYIFVVRPDGTLVGVLNLRQLIMAQPQELVQDIMIADPVRVHHADSHDNVAEMVEKYDLLALPVVDAEDVLIGMITVDDVVSHIAKQAWKRKLGR